MQFKRNNNSPRVQCQFCDKVGHQARQCYRAKDYFRDMLSQPQVHYANSNSTSNSSWVLDTGASHHVTNDLQNLSLHTAYDGPDELQLRDGSGLQISHIGSSFFRFPSKIYALKNVLCVPKAQTNLVSVSSFCKSNNVSVEFFSNFFLVKDQSTGEILAKGPLEHSLYHLSSSHFPSPIPIAQYGFRTALLPNSGTVVWVIRHPGCLIICCLNLSYLFISMLNNTLCNSCQCNKSHRLPFGVSSLTSSRPLELLYSDVWGLLLLHHSMVFAIILYLLIIFLSI